MGDAMREAFERWWMDHNATIGAEMSHSYLLERDEDGDYKRLSTMDAWQGWQAATEWATEDEPIGEIDEGDDGAFVELYPDNSFTLGQKVYSSPTKQAGPKEKPVAYMYKYLNPTDGSPVWRFDGGVWNGQRPRFSKPLYERPPAPERVVPGDAYRLIQCVGNALNDDNRREAIHWLHELHRAMLNAAPQPMEQQ